MRCRAIVLLAVTAGCAPPPRTASPEPAASIEAPAIEPGEEQPATPSPPVDRWQQVQAKGDGTLRYFFTFQDERRLWRCEGRRCTVRVGPGADETTVTVPCLVHRAPTATSPSGRWLAQACEGKLHRHDMAKDLAHPAVLHQAEALHELCIDDEGTITATADARDVLRTALAGALVRHRLTPPMQSLHPDSPADIRPADGPWLAYSDGAYADEVAWTAAEAPIRMHGGALRNRDQIWVSLMKGGYAKLEGTSLVPVSGRFGGGLPGHGLLMEVQPWGPRALMVVYETALQLKDAELETVAEIELPPADGLLQVGSDPHGRRLHVSSPYGELYLRGVPSPP